MGETGFYICLLLMRQNEYLLSSGLNREYVYSAVVYQKYLTRLRELIIFEPWVILHGYSRS